VPDAVAARLAGALRLLVRAQPLERAVVDVHTREATGELLVAEIAVADPHIREQPAVAVARRLGGVSLEDGRASLCERARVRGRLRRVAPASLGGVDPDQPDPLRPAARQPHVDRVAVDDIGDGSAQLETGSVGRLCRGREQSRDAECRQECRDSPH